MARDNKDPHRIAIPVLDNKQTTALNSQDRHDVAYEPIGIIDTQGRIVKKVVLKSECPTLRSQTHGNEPNVCIKVRQATKQGYAECLVGGGQIV